MKWLEMEPEERDRLVAERVMGWKAQQCDGEMGEQHMSCDGWICLKCHHEGCWGDDFDHEEIPPHYSTSMDIAWSVAMLDKWNCVKVVHFKMPCLPDHLQQEECHIKFAGKSYIAFGKTAPEAICLAALKACSVEIE